MINFSAVLNARLQQQTARALYREVQQAPAIARNFASNDYLYLSRDSRVCQVLADYARGQFGAGSAEVLGGHSEALAQLASDLCAFSAAPAALIFANGFMANLAVSSALLRRGDSLLQDRLNHASLVEGGAIARGFGVRELRYQHVNMQSLQTQLARATGCKLVVSDALFSMDGDLAPLPQLLKICNRSDTLLAIDDAHGFGTLAAGRGSLAHFQLTPAVLRAQQLPLPLQVVTFGKALGGFGAAVLGEQLIIDNLRQFARSYIYSTAVPAALAAAHAMALHIVKTEPWRSAKLSANVNYFIERAQYYALPLNGSCTHIQVVPIGASERALALAAKMRARGFYTPAIRPPTVPQNSARLRFSLNCAHSFADIDAVLATLRAELSAG